MHYIENDTLKIAVDEKGAELKSAWHKVHSLEYMWDADPAFWAKSSPVLFPIVGALKENRYQYNGQQYQLSRHGFARDKKFSVTENGKDFITFTLKYDQDTLKVYPFPFSFSITYTLHDDMLTVSYQVSNEGEDTMLFSVGGHPAFKVPLVPGTTYNDYRLRFEKQETAGRWPISKDGLIESQPEPLLNGTDTLPLSKELFSKDALVLKHLESDWVELTSDKTTHGIRFSRTGFPYLGLWAAPGADFVCIEPWCGIADSVNTDQQLEHKEGIHQLQQGQQFRVQWQVHFY